MSDTKQPAFYFKIKSSDPEKLSSHIRKFIGTGTMMIGDLRDKELFELIQSLVIQVGHVNNTCVVMIPLNSHEALDHVSNAAEKALKAIDDTGLRVTGTIGLGLTLKDLLAFVD